LPREPRVTALVVAAAASLAAAGFALYARAAWPWVGLGFVALVPWLTALDRVRTLRGALAAGLLMAVAFELAVFGWFAPAIADYTAAPVWVHVAILALAAPLLQPQFVTTALARAALRRDGGGPVALALATAATYVATEAVVPKLFGDTLGYPLYGSVWLRQGGDVAGVPGLTVVVVLVNALLAAAARAVADREPPGRRVLPLAAAATLVVALAGYGAWRSRTLATGATGEGVTVGIVQANLGHYDRMAAEIGRYETVRLILDEHVARSAPALARDDLGLLVWPETVYPTTFGKPKSEDGAAFDREIADFVARAGVPLVFGAYDADGGAEYNAAFFLAPDAGGPHPFAIYRKTRLFPLTERVPAVLESQWLRETLPWLGTWTEGAGARVVPIRLRDGRTIRAAPLICYDVLDPEIARAAARDGADLIVTLSNDSWFAFGPGPDLHMLGAAFRSIETHRPQVRSTNTGISAVIDATGTVVARAGVDTHATLVATVVPAHQVVTIVMRYGEWMTPLCFVVTVWLLLGRRVARRWLRAGR
jgi:apolipoprotein N-acyltransferase